MGPRKAKAGTPVHKETPRPMTPTGLSLSAPNIFSPSHPNRMDKVIAAFKSAATGSDAKANARTQIAAYIMLEAVDAKYLANALGITALEAQMIFPELETPGAGPSLEQELEEAEGMAAQLETDAEIAVAIGKGLESEEEGEDTTVRSLRFKELDTKKSTEVLEAAPFGSAVEATTKEGVSKSVAQAHIDRQLGGTIKKPDMSKLPKNTASVGKVDIDEEVVSRASRSKKSEKKMDDDGKKKADEEFNKMMRDLFKKK